MSIFDIKNLRYFLLGYFTVAIFILFYFNGTGDSGDSVLHFLISNASFEHPKLFLHHWGKPIFTTLSSPFAYFGFNGIQLFNVLVVGATLYFIIKIAALLEYERPLLCGVFLLSAPSFVSLIFSGLTEFLFGLFLVVSIFLIFKKKIFWATFLISFLPFVRTEGYGILLLFLVFLILTHHWKYLPLLLFGNLLYGIIGFIALDDFFWMFNQNPYDPTGSVYGSGKILHFVDKLYYIIGPFIYACFIIGIFQYLFNLRSFKNHSTKITFLLILGSVATYFIGHSVMWYLGRFGSMGLKRVLNAILPLLCIISLVGFNTILRLLSNKQLKKTIGPLLIGIIVLLPFTEHPIAYRLPQDFTLTSDQALILQLANDPIITDAIQPNQLFFYSHPYLSIALKVPHFQFSTRRNINSNIFTVIQKGDIIIWDSNFALEDYQVEIADLLALENIKVLKTYGTGTEGIKLYVLIVE